jgi:hypothetical protein
MYTVELEKIKKLKYICIGISQRNKEQKKQETKLYRMKKWAKGA